MQDYLLRFVVLTLATWLNRQAQLIIEYQQEEIRILREQQGSKRLVFTDEQRRRLAVCAHELGPELLKNISTIVTPATLLGWFRKLVAAKYDGSAKRGRKPGRPATSADIAQLVITMARENPTWGYTRICGALYNLGHDIARNTVKRILLDAGLEPAPEHGKKLTWSTFIKSHLGCLVATDFFSTEVLMPWGPVRYMVLFVIEVKSRRVHVAGIHEQPYGGWMAQIARNQTDATSGFLTLSGARYLIHDRDTLFTEQFSAILATAGVDTVKLPARSPNLNAFAERFVASIKRECLNQVIPLGEAHLRQIITEYVTHYNTERNHQSLGNQLLGARPVNDVFEASDERGPGAVKRQQRLGGLLNFYYRDVA
jgi:hypothetical protein